MFILSRNNGATSSQKNLPQKGFSLIETVVSIGLLLAAFSMFVDITIISFRLLHTAENKYLATRIAEDGMELFISKKNNHVFCIESGGCPSLSSWQDGLVGNWEINAKKSNQLLAHGNLSSFDPGDYICIIPSGNDAGKFGYCGGTSNDLPGNFTREISTTALGTDKIYVKSIVKWKDVGVPQKTITVEAVLYGLP